MAEGLISVPGYTEHLVLASGLLIRDINIAHFAQPDPDAPWPDELPLYLAETNFTLERLSEVTDILETVHEFILKSQVTPQVLVTAGPSLQKRPGMVKSSTRTKSVSPPIDPSLLDVSGHTVNEHPRTGPSSAYDGPPSDMTGPPPGPAINTPDAPPHPPADKQQAKAYVPKPRQPARKPKESIPSTTVTKDPNAPSEHIADGLTRMLTNHIASGDKEGDDNGRHSKRLQSKPKVHWTKAGIPVVEEVAKELPDIGKGQKGSGKKAGQKK